VLTQLQLLSDPTSRGVATPKETLFTSKEARVVSRSMLVMSKRRFPVCLLTTTSLVEMVGSKICGLDLIFRLTWYIGRVGFTLA